MLKDLIGNKTAEKDIRDWLSQNNWYGNSAKFIELELHAIQPPGWLQVFRFTVNAKATSDQRGKLFGVLRDDERFRRIEIEVFEDEPARNERLQEWSAKLSSVTPNLGTGDAAEPVPMMANTSELITFLIFGIVILGAIGLLLAYFGQ